MGVDGESLLVDHDEVVDHVRVQAVTDAEAEKWNGQLPQVSGGDTIPLLSLPLSNPER